MIVFKGNFAKIGKQIGEYYRVNGTRLSKIKVDEELFQIQLEIYQKYYPELLVELEETAKVAGFDVREFIARRICGEIIWYRKLTGNTKACTIFGVKNKNGLLVGRNYDWNESAAKGFQIYKTENSEVFDTITITDMEIENNSQIKNCKTFFSPNDAINEKGLYIGLTFSHHASWGYGINSIYVIKKIAETCETVEEAIEFFQNTPVACPKNYFIADRFGNMAVIEHVSEKFVVRYPENGRLVITNHNIDPDLAKDDLVKVKYPYHTTFARYDEVMEKLNEKPDTEFDEINEILCSEDSVTLQSHSQMQTVWSLSMNMEKAKYKVYWDFFYDRKVQELNF